MAVAANPAAAARPPSSQTSADEPPSDVALGASGSSPRSFAAGNGWMPRVISRTADALSFAIGIQVYPPYSLSPRTRPAAGRSAVVNVDRSPSPRMVTTALYQGEAFGGGAVGGPPPSIKASRWSWSFTSRQSEGPHTLALATSFAEAWAAGTSGSAIRAKPTITRFITAPFRDFPLLPVQPRRRAGSPTDECGARRPPPSRR